LGGALVVIVLGAIAMRLSSIKIILPSHEHIENSDAKKESDSNISPLA
jgi:hypothetical protein